MKTYVNLLPWSCRRARLVRRRAVQWSLVWAACACLLGGDWWLKHGNYQDELDAQQYLERRHAPIARLSDEMVQLGARLRSLHQQEQRLSQFVDQRPALTVVGLVSRSARACQGEIQVEHLTLQLAEDQAAPQDAAQAGKVAASLVLKGMGLNNLAVARFVTALRDSAAFERVELKSSVEHTVRDGQAWQYQIECGY